MKPNLIFISILCIVFTTTCSKKKYPRVEYKVTSYSSAFIAYTMVTGTISQETVSGSWSKSFKHKQGATVLLQATHFRYRLYKHFCLFQQKTTLDKIFIYSR